MTSIGGGAFDNTPWWNTYSANTENHSDNIIYINLVAYKAVSTNITSCTFKEGTVSISDCAFFGCTNLTSVNIPNSVTSIGEFAFRDCTSLGSVTIPNSVTSIGGFAFNGCTSLASVTIPSSVTSIGEKAFYYCTSLESATCWATSVPTLGTEAFSSNKDGRNIYVLSNLVNTYKAAPNWSDYDDNIQAIGNAWSSGSCVAVLDNNTLTISGNGAMANYLPIPDKKPWYSSSSSITSVVIEDGVTSIGRSAFQSCTNLASVTIGSSVTSIGDYAFDGCDNLASVNIPNSVTSIGEGAFWSCTSLASVTIPNSVESIGGDAFAGCTSLASVTIPNSVTSIGVNAFRHCTSLASITVESGNSKYDSRDNCNAIIESETNTLIAGCKNTVIPNSVTSIGESAFHACTNLTSVTIPNSVTSIGGYAFNSCTSLASVTIPNSVTSIGGNAFEQCTHLGSITFADNSQLTSIGEQAFYNCTSLASITIPNSVTSIGDGAFNYCNSLASVTIGSGVTSIGNEAFDACTKLASVTCWATSVPTLGTEALNDCSALTAIYVLSDVVNTYKAATNWLSYAGKITAIDNPAAVTASQITESGFEGNWCTYYNSNSNVQVDDATTIYTISEASGSTATISAVSGKIIKAGEGVILKSTDSSISLTYTSTAATDADYTSNLLEGCDAQTTISTSDYADKVIYTMADDEGLGFYKYYDNVSDEKYTTNTTLGANKAFLALDAAPAASARGFVFQFGEDNNAAGIESLTPDPSPKGEGSGYYSLEGRKLNGKPTRKGVYIYNGKKIIVR